MAQRLSLTRRIFRLSEQVGNMTTQFGSMQKRNIGSAKEVHHQNEL